LSEHPRAAAKTQVSRRNQRAKALRIDKFVRGERSVALTMDQNALTELVRLDGCYALRTDLSKAAISKEIVRDRYKDLTQVEWAFRGSRSVHLENAAGLSARRRPHAWPRRRRHTGLFDGAGAASALARHRPDG